eukprot:768746-Hanusia_phi.AAC.14
MGDGDVQDQAHPMGGEPQAQSLHTGTGLPAPARPSLTVRSDRIGPGGGTTVILASRYPGRADHRNSPSRVTGFRDCESIESDRTLNDSKHWQSPGQTGGTHVVKVIIMCLPAAVTAAVILCLSLIAGTKTHSDHRTVLASAPGPPGTPPGPGPRTRGQSCMTHVTTVPAGRAAGGEVATYRTVVPRSTVLRYSEPPGRGPRRIKFLYL